MMRRALIPLLALLLLAAGLSAPAAAQQLDGGGDLQGDAVLETNSGLEVTLTGPTNVSWDSLFSDDNTIDLETASGNATFSATGTSSADIVHNEISGEWTNVTDLSVAQNSIEINPEDKQAVTVAGDTDALSFRAVTLDDGAADVYYRGTSGSTTLTVTGLPADQRVRAYDTSTDTVLDAAVTDGSGVATFNLPNSEHTVELQSTDAQPDLSNPTPDSEVNNRNVTVSVDADHPDFPGVETTVNISVNGTQVHNETITEASTIETSLTVDGGTHDVTATAEDEFGETDTLNWTFSTPTDIEVRKENSPDQLVDNRTVSVEFYDEGSDTVYTRETSDGTIDREGLPADTTLIVSTEASGYANRQFIIDSLSEQSTIYLLNTSEVDTNEITFTLTDRTGQYPPESTELFIKKPITRNNTTTYQTVAADTFGVNGYTTILESGQRYRLSVRNQDGDVRVLDRYTPTVDEIVELTVGDFEFEYDGEGRSYQWNAAMDTTTVTVNGEDQQRDQATFEYSDPYGLTETLEVDIYEKGNQSNVLLDEEYESLGNISYTQTLSENNTGKTWVVAINGTRDGAQVEGQTLIGGNDLQPGIPLDPWWKEVLSVFALFVLAGVFGGVRAEAGAIVVALAAGVMYYMGWLPGDITAGMIIVALFVAVAYRWVSANPGPGV